jgi:hypothetical protein
MSDPAFKRPDDVEMIQVPNTLKLKVGSRFGALNPGTVAKAEAALKSLSGQFTQWMTDELNKLEDARYMVKTQGMNAQTGEKLYTHAHDMKGLGGTYDYPIVTRIAGSLCKLIEEPEERHLAPMTLIDAHVDAVKACVRDAIKTDDHPMGRALVEALEAQVALIVR